MSQVLQLKRSDKNYIAGIKRVMKKQNDEAIELNWLDKNIELLKQGKTKELSSLWVIER